MLSSATLFLARRYLRAGRSFVSVITVISIIGVAVGVLMMIVVNSVMKGFEAEFRRVLIGSEPHMLLHPLENKTASPQAVADVIAKVRTRPEVAAASSYVKGAVYAEHDGRQFYMDILGLPADGAPFYMAKIASRKLDGSLELRPDGVFSADYIAGQLDARTGDKLSVYASTNVTTTVQRFRVVSDEEDEAKRHAGYKEIKLHPQEVELQGYARAEMDGAYSYMTLETAQRIFGLGGQVSGVIIELQQPNQAKAVRDRFAAAGLIPAGWKATLWSDDNEARLAAMSNERVMMGIVLVIIGLVAAFSVMNTTITVTTQKRREIGVLTALGSRQGQIIGVFVAQAAFVGVVGTVGGLVLSGLVLAFRAQIGTAIGLVSGGGAGGQGGFLSIIPAQIEPWFVVGTCAGSIALCLLAALPPAWLAARVDPAVALRD